MAQLKNTHRIFDMHNNASMTIGNNRTLTRINRAKWVGALHGHPIFTIICDMGVGTDGSCRITLNTCGYMTPTTRDAMSDFCEAFGVVVGVSFAKGVFTARHDGKIMNSNGYGVLKFNAQRFGVTS
jgi:hypothetical protein